MPGSGRDGASESEIICIEGARPDLPKVSTKRSRASRPARSLHPSLILPAARAVPPRCAMLACAFPLPQVRLASKQLGQRGYAASAVLRGAPSFGLRPVLRAQTEEEGGNRLLRMVMFGKPGAGKGTLSGRLTKKYDIVSISSGDVLRQHIAERCVLHH